MADDVHESEDARVHAAQVVVYHSPYCGYSRSALAWFERRRIPVEVVVSLGQPELRAWLRRTTGQATLPQVFIRGESVGGYSDLLELELTGEVDAWLVPEPGRVR